MKIIDEFDRRSYRNVWTVSECAGGDIHPVSYELLGKARELAAAGGCEVWTVVLGSGFSEHPDALYAYGADVIVAVDDARMRAFNDELECHVLERLVEKYRPEIVLCAATSRGRALIPRLAEICFRPGRPSAATSWPRSNARITGRRWRPYGLK